MSDEALRAARVLMGDSLGFHIIFVLFGLTLPILVSWFEWRGIIKNDQKLIAIAKFWSKIMALLVIAGVISGTVIALQMSLVWPGILKFGGEVIGLPFMFETYAFLIEAVFLAVYMATWNNKKISPRLHAVFGLFVILGSTLSAYAITSVNGWMNLPKGFEFVNGKLENISVVKAMFSQTAIIEFVHSMPGYYLSASLTIAGLYMIKILKSRYKDRFSKKHIYDWIVVRSLLAFGIVMFIFSAVTADITGKYLAKHEPSKLAALELVYETGSEVPLIVGGVGREDGSIAGPHFKIPSGLSLLAGNSTNTVVLGLNEFKKEDQPPLYIHTLFDIKMTLITALVAIFAGYIALRKWRPEMIARTPVLVLLSLTGLMCLAIVELGWMITEIGRQPWAVRGYLRTSEAVTQTHDITSFGYLFPVAYLLLFIVTVLGIKRIIADEANKKGGAL